ncbi:MAG TPA: mevalonate kinase [Gammaproteobacteria bacterium]|nr:mevalonate kinase [Gammaproteobacteria bacterium]
MSRWILKVHAPGKLILSGEHAVVYGKPALAMAVNRYATAFVSPQLLPLVSFDLSDLSYEHGLTFTALNCLKGRIKQNYQRFISGDFKIRDVLQKPVELAQFAFSLFLETLNLKLTQGIKIRVQSDIPIGCGMGSSAATVLSIVHAIAHHLQIELSEETFFRLSLEAENMQHGYSSGLDLQVSMHGGCVLVKNGQTFQRCVPTFPMYLINTGTPKTTTGECVAHAASYFKQSTIGDDFAAVTEAMDTALQANDYAEIKRVLSLNHELLVKIDVVPLKVQQFISEIKKFSGAAKICGAGAVFGEKGGIVLVLTENYDALMKLCAEYHYPILPIIGETRGVHIV